MGAQSFASSRVGSHLSAPARWPPPPWGGLSTTHLCCGSRRVGECGNCSSWHGDRDGEHAFQALPYGLVSPLFSAPPWGLCRSCDPTRQYLAPGHLQRPLQPAAGVHIPEERAATDG